MLEFEKIVVRIPNWVGDAVMALPFLSSLRRNAPKSEITVLVRPMLADLFVQVASCDRVIALDESRGRHGLIPLWRNAKQLRIQKYDLGFALPPSFGAALMLRLAGVKRRVGHAADRRAWLLTDSHPYLANGQRPHRADSYISLLEEIWPSPLSDKQLTYDPGVTAQAQARELIDRFRISNTDQVLAIAPGAGQPNKLWRTSGFAEVANRWLAVEDSAVILIGGPEDRRACQDVAAQSPPKRVFNLCDSGDLTVVAALIKRAQMFVGNDSGLSHLAAAVGVPVVVISGPGDPSEVSPYTKAAITVKKSLYCSPCYSNSCYRQDHPLECQDLVTADDVWKAITELRASSSNPANLLKPKT